MVTRRCYCLGSSSTGHRPIHRSCGHECAAYSSGVLLSFLLALLTHMFMTYRRFLFVIDDDMRDLIKFLRRPLGKMIPGTRLPIINSPCLWDPGREIQQ